VTVGLTFADPCGVVQGLHTAWFDPSTTVNVVGVPPVICQVSVTCCPGVIVLGDAENEMLSGTVTVTVCGPAVPPGPVAVKEKVVVWVIGTTADPEVGGGPESSPSGISGLNVTEVALVVAQVSVVV